MSAFALAVMGAVAGLGLFIMARSFLRDDRLPLTDLRAGPHSAAANRAAALQGAPASLVLGSGPGRRARTGAPAGGARGALGRLGVAVMDALGFTDTAKLNDQLRVLGRTVEQHAYEKMLGAVTGFVLPIVTAVVLAAGGVGVSPVLIVLVSLVAGVSGFFYPDLPLNERVEERRRTFRHALGSYLDLVTILLAGGAGIESALEGAAEDGDGWPFVELRNAIRRARLTRSSPWEAFEELGIELGVTELQELASSVALAGSQGARIKQSLTAKAEAMRAAQAAELEIAAERQTEKMLVPLMVMAFGLTLFIGFGAVQSITTNDTPPTATIDSPVPEQGEP